MSRPRAGSQPRRSNVPEERGSGGRPGAGRPPAEGWQVIAVDNSDPYYSKEAKRRNIGGRLDHANRELLELDIDRLRKEGG